MQKLCGKLQSRLQNSNSEPIYSSIDSYPIRTPRRESNRRQSDVSEADGVVLVTDYEDTEPLFRVQHNESDSESSWDEDLGDGQVEVEIYEDRDECFIKRDELFDNATESRYTTDTEQTFLKNVDDILDSDQTFLKNIGHRLQEDASPESTFANPPLICVDETVSLSIQPTEKIYVNEVDQIALYGETLTGDNNERCSSESKQESPDENSNNANTNHYEQLGDNLDDHHYMLPPSPPIIEAISEEMEEDGVTAEQVIEISRANTHNDDDDDDNNTESPVTNYVSGGGNTSGETSPP